MCIASFQYKLVRWPRVKRLLSEQEIFKLMNAKSFAFVWATRTQSNSINSYTHYTATAANKNTHQCNKTQNKRRKRTSPFILISTIIL